MTGWPEPEAAPVAVVFRADASTAIGTGHVMRCLSIAAAVRQLGAVCHFVSREFEGHLFDVVREAGCTQHVVEGDETQWIDELLPRLGRPRVVLDHYGLDADVEMRVGLKAAGVMVIDDLADRPHDCDVLVDGGLLPGSVRSYRGLVPARTRILAGPAFAPLRGEFARARATMRARTGSLEHILVAFGGSDPTGETAIALEGIEGWRRSVGRTARVTVVAGPSNLRAAALAAAFQGVGGVTVLARTSDMARLMAQADVAVGACGTSAWERCALGLPALVTVVADNQRMQAVDLARAGAIVVVGQGGEARPDDYARALSALTPALLDDMGRRAMALTDGLGAERLAEILVPSTHVRFGVLGTRPHTEPPG